MASRTATKTVLAQKADGLQVGDKAPDFSLASDDCGKVSRASLKGRAYVIYFYPKDDTSGCTREAVDFSAAARKFEALGVFVLGISKDSLESHEKFRRKHKLKVAQMLLAQMQVLKMADLLQMIQLKMHNLKK
jgi:peroxiredoxin Q/BCP